MVGGTVPTVRRTLTRGSRTGAPKFTDASQALGDGREQPPSQREGGLWGFPVPGWGETGGRKGLDLSEGTPEGISEMKVAPTTQRGLGARRAASSEPPARLGSPFPVECEAAEAEKGEGGLPATCQVLWETVDALPRMRDSLGGWQFFRGHQSQRAAGSPWERSEHAAKTSPGLKAKAKRTQLSCSQRLCSATHW